MCGFFSKPQSSGGGGGLPQLGDWRPPSEAPRPARRMETGRAPGDAGYTSPWPVARAARRPRPCREPGEVRR